MELLCKYTISATISRKEREHSRTRVVINTATSSSDHSGLPSESQSQIGVGHGYFEVKQYCSMPRKYYDQVRLKTEIFLFPWLGFHIASDAILHVYTCTHTSHLYHKAHLQLTSIACRGTIFMYENPIKAEIHPIRLL